MQKVYLLDAYHGTDLSSAKNIVANKTFNLGRHRPDHWLGHGAYFFREDLDQAYLWAVHKIDGLNLQEAPAVINLTIQVARENFLYINSRKGLTYLENFIKEKKKQIYELGVKFKSDGKLLRCFLFNLLPKEIKVIQGIFFMNSHFDDDPIIKSAEIKLAGIQICVRDVSVINNREMNIIKIGKVRNKTKNKEKNIIEIGKERDKKRIRKIEWKEDDHNEIQ
jgi:hypothetical protein